MAEDLVKMTTEAGIGTISLNRPAQLNALTRDMMSDLRRALARYAEDPEIRVIRLTGAGRGFCAGQDLSERDPRGRTDPFDLEALQIELFHPVIRLMTTMEKPIVAQVNGLAAGAGVSLALAADIVVATQSARFILSFSKVGLSVDAGGGWALVRALGPARARAALMLGATIPADEAAATGLIHESAPDDTAEARVDAILDRLRATPRTALASIKRAVAAVGEAPDLDSYLGMEARFQGEAGRDPDYAEGVLSFLEKRAPRFR